MALSVGHSLTMTTPDDPAYENRPSHWNQGHVLSGFGGASGLNVGTVAGTVAAGDDFRFSPAQTIQVAENATQITGQWYSSIKAACDYAATVAVTGQRYFIQVYGGEYTEAPFTVPAFTFLAGTDEWAR